MIAVKSKDLERVAQVYTEAFIDQPLYAYLCPDESKRLAFVHDFFLFRAKFALKKGYLYADSPEINCVMAAEKPGKEMRRSDLLLLGGLSALNLAGSGGFDRMMEFMSFIGKGEAIACEGYKYRYFMGPLAVKPSMQGKGLGSEMMEYMTNVVCTGKFPRVLDTQSPDGVRLYEKYGYHLVCENDFLDTGIKSFTLVNTALAKKGK